MTPESAYEQYDMESEMDTNKTLETEETNSFKLDLNERERKRFAKTIRDTLPLMESLAGHLETGDDMAFVTDFLCVSIQSRYIRELGEIIRENLTRDSLEQKRQTTGDTKK
jgi:hypothetical protein